jgi:GT2 family glycosyltransferase
MNLDAHGEEAARVAGRIAGEATIVACEPEFAESALANGLSLRRAGVHFVLSVHFEDVRSRLIRERSAALCATYATWDEVRLAFDQAMAPIIATPNEVPKAQRDALFEAARLADSVVTRSWAEFERFRHAVYSVRRNVDIVVNEDPDVPESVTGPRTDAVVYAPRYRADELAVFVAALGDFEVPVTIVARDQPTIPTRVRFVPPSEAAAALGRARVIVDAAGNDPGTALALAKLGRPLVVSAANGSAEIVRSARSYDLWNRRSILTAVVNGFASDPPVLRKGHYEDRPALRQPLVFGPDAPLVSVIVPTYNRPELLALTLDSIQRQTYPALEIVVVNDAGRDVADVIARFSRARLVNQPVNRGPAPARNRGLAEARGEFVIFFDDDDEMFPNHIAAHVNTLQRSGLDVAYGQMINCFTVHTGGGRYAVDRIEGHVALLDHADIQWAGSLATTALMFRRSLIDDMGPIDEALPAAEDYEFWLRLATGREWARVPDVTSMYFIRNDGSNRSAGGARKYFLAHQAIYAKHPTTRPLVQAGRHAMLELFSQTSG